MNSMVRRSWLSFPWITGVWVVNTTWSRVLRHASSNERPADLCSSINSTRGEDGMTLVEVVDVDGESEGPQRPNTTDAEHDLLRQPLFLEPAVELAADPPIVGVVLWQVGVEQVERRVAVGLGLPHLDLDLAAREW